VNLRHGFLIVRKTRDFIWKSTQHAYKIGECWQNIRLDGFQPQIQREGGFLGEEFRGATSKKTWNTS